MSSLIEPEEIQIEQSDEQVKLPDSLPVLPLRDIVIFPYMIVPLFVQRERSIRAVEQALAENRMIMLVAQRDLEKEEPIGRDLYNHGTAASIMRMLKMPDGRIRILVQGLARANVTRFDENLPHLQAHILPLADTEPDADELELEALIRNVRASLERAITLGKNISGEVMAIVANLEDPGRLADVAASNLELKVVDAQSVLEKLNPSERLHRVNELLAREINVLMVQQEINTQAKGEIDRSQREFYLRQQLKAIQTELGEGNELGEEITQYREKMLQAKLPEPVEEEVDRQIKKLERMHPDAAEAATLRNYLDVMVASALVQVVRGKPGPQARADYPGRGPLRARKSQRANHRITGSAQAKRESQRTDPLSRRTAGRRENQPGPLDRQGAQPQVPEAQPGRLAR